MKRSTKVLAVAAVIIFAALVGGWQMQSSAGLEYGVYSTNAGTGRYRWRTSADLIDAASAQELWRRMGVLAVQPEPQFTDNADVINYLTDRGWELDGMTATDYAVTYVFVRRAR